MAGHMVLRVDRAAPLRNRPPSEAARNLQGPGSVRQVAASFVRTAVKAHSREGVTIETPI